MPALRELHIAPTPAPYLSLSPPPPRTGKSPFISILSQMQSGSEVNLASKRVRAEGSLNRRSEISQVAPELGVLAPNPHSRERG